MTNQTQISLRFISKELISLAFPMALTQLIAVGSGFLYIVILSSFGKDVLAASALIFSSRISILLIAASLLFSLSILISHAYGERQYERIGIYVQQGWTLGFLISFPVIILFLNLDTILLHFGQAKNLTVIVKKFYSANIWQVTPYLLTISNQQLLYGTRKQRVDLILTVITVFFGLTSAYFFTSGIFGIPKFGITGVAYAMVLQGVSYFLMTSAVIYSSNFFKKFELFHYRAHLHLRYMIEMFKVGWPICVQISGEMLSYLIFATMVGWIGVRALAAYQVVIQYVLLIVVPLFALAQASGVLISQAFGEKKFFIIPSIGQAASIFSIFLSIVVGIIFFVFPKQLATMYMNINDPANTEVLQLITLLFMIVAFTQLIDGLRNVLTGCLRGLFDTKYPMYLGLISIWFIGIPGGYILAFHFNYGVLGIALGALTGFLVGMLLVLIRWLNYTKKIIKNV